MPLSGIAFATFTVWTKHQRKLAELNLEASAEKAAQYATNNARLEERVRVLERIISDGGYDTALQIEALRDKSCAALENADN
ncbi:MAG: hypothetical protein P8Y48_15480 [Novosphingobium sp.]